MDIKLFVCSFVGRTLAEHMLALPWTEELLARAIEQNLYHGRHMTFCRKRDDKLALVRRYFRMRTCFVTCFFVIKLKLKLFFTASRHTNVP